MGHADRDSWDMTLHPLKSINYIILSKGGAKGRSGFKTVKTAHREGIRHLIPWYLKVYPKTKGRDSPRQSTLTVLRRKENMDETT
jgi:hypothetical protein